MQQKTMRCVLFCPAALAFCRVTQALDPLESHETTAVPLGTEYGLVPDDLNPTGKLAKLTYQGKTIPTGADTGPGTMYAGPFTGDWSGQPVPYNYQGSYQISGPLTGKANDGGRTSGTTYTTTFDFSGMYNHVLPRFSYIIIDGLGVLNATSSATINANGTVQMSGGVLATPTLNVLGTFVLTGGVLQVTAVQNGGTFNLAGTSTQTLDTLDGIGTTTISAGQTLTATYFRQGTLSLTGTATGLKRDRSD